MSVSTYFDQFQSHRPIISVLNEAGEFCGLCVRCPLCRWIGIMMKRRYSPSHFLCQSAKIICCRPGQDFHLFGVPGQLALVEMIAFFIMHELELFVLLLVLKVHLGMLWDYCPADCGVANEAI
jgi:hypothetical protein